MESVITASGLSAHWNGAARLETPDPHFVDPGKLTDRLSTLIINEDGKSRFLGNAPVIFKSSQNI